MMFYQAIVLYKIFMTAMTRLAKLILSHYARHDLMLPLGILWIRHDLL